VADLPKPGLSRDRVCEVCRLTRWEAKQVDGWMGELTRERDEARAEVERLRDIIGKLYMQRGAGGDHLYDAIRAAFRDRDRGPAVTASRESGKAGDRP
jgi:hypothetical protein